jgi:beta-glucosidase/6-phospho-beta-glucosidase/beta-galactosidase
MIAWQPWRPWAVSDHLAVNMVRHLFQDLILATCVWGTMRIPGRRSILMPEVANTLDWIGVNYYQRYRVSFTVIKGLITQGKDMIGVQWKTGEQKGPREWGEIYPRGLGDTLASVWKRYRIPIMITENGIPDETDQHRPGFIVSHLHELWQAIQRGIPVKGYYFWSLIDNFEWTEGYDPSFRFGLIGVDFKTQERHIRPSGHLYAEICRAGGIMRDAIEGHAPHLAPQLFKA